MNDKANFVENGHFHVYNKTYNKYPLFQNDDNKKYFLLKFKYFLGDFAYLNAYALLSNHYHFLIHIKSLEEILNNINSYNNSKQTKFMKTLLSNFDKEEYFHDLIVHQFTRLFISYAKSFNKVFDTEGGLFKDSFKRSHLTTNERLSFIYYYIHHNFRKHRLNNVLDNGLNKSYNSIINQDGTLVNYKFAFEWFGSQEDFIKYHEQDLDF